MNAQEVFSDVVVKFRETALLETSRALLEWDERTGLPRSAGGYRAEQITLLSSLIHRRKTDPRLGDQLNELLDSEIVREQQTPESATVRRLHKDYQRNTKLPVELVEAISKATVLGQQAWEEARAADDWERFKPHMEEIFELRKREAELLRSDGPLYDTLLDQYEEGASSQGLTEIFTELREALVQLVRDLSSVSSMPSGDSWRASVPVATQRKTSRWIAEAIGFNFERGRLDETTHPFCTTLGPDDCRILTRFQESYFPSGFYGTLHEAGHGLYEQGLPTEWFGLPPGSYASLGVHESQSRLWENFVGRSSAFWKWCLPQLRPMIGSAWQDLSVESVFRDANLVQPSMIRVEADEVTYNLHILIRFEIEQELMTGELEVADAPDAWNERYMHYLGIRPPSNRDGILQDVHWSAGLVGYFPTYSLGNVYAAQLMEAAEADLGDCHECFARGSFEPLLSWMRQNVHAHGFSYHPQQLVERTSGKPLSSQPLVTYLRNKLETVYG